MVYPTSAARASLRLAAAVAAVLLGGCATSDGWSHVRTGHHLLKTAFSPDRNFAGDLRSSSDDHLLLTAAASNRDDYAPAFSLAIAYRCLPVSGRESGNWTCRYVARLLRVGPPGEEQ